MGKTLCLILVALALATTPARAQNPIEIATGASPKSAAISPDGSLAYVMNLEACSVSVFDTKTHKLVRTISFPQTPATGYDYKKNREIPSVAEKPVEGAFTQRGRYLWISFHNGAEVVVFATQGRGFDPKLYRNAITAIVREADGRTWKRGMLAIPTGKTPKVIEVSPDEKWVAVSNWHGYSVTIIDAQQMKAVKTLPVSSIPRGMAFSRDSRKLFVGIMGGSQIDVFDTRTWKRRNVIANVGAGPRALILDRAGRYLYASCNSSCVVTKIDATRGKVVGAVAVGIEPRTIAFSPDESRIYAVCYGSHKLCVVDTRTFKVIDTRRTGENPVGMAVTPAGDVWVTNQSGDSVTLFPFGSSPRVAAVKKPVFARPWSFHRS